MCILGCCFLRVLCFCEYFSVFVVLFCCVCFWVFLHLIVLCVCVFAFLFLVFIFGVYFCFVLFACVLSVLQVVFVFAFRFWGTYHRGGDLQERGAYGGEGGGEKNGDGRVREKEGGFHMGEWVGGWVGGWEQKDGKTKNTSQNMVKIYTYAPLVPVYDKYLQPIQHCYNTSIRVGGALSSNPALFRQIHRLLI